MEISEMIGLGYVVFATLTTQLPHVLFRHHSKMTGAELAEKYPKLAWLRYTYPVSSVLWFLVFGGIPIFLMIITAPFGEEAVFLATIYILGATIGSMSILHGGISLLTNVCPLPRKRNRLYVYDEDMQPTAFMILAMGLFVIIIAMVMVYFYVI
jgi:hypothetical protein